MRTILPDVLGLQPYYRECVWGGQRLRDLYGKPLPGEVNVGEAFEVSALKGQEATVAEGPLAGQNLRILTEEYGPELVGSGVWSRYNGEFPLLVKLIDAHDDLSIQVHPDDDYARANGLGSQGKMEAWFVLRSTGGRAVFGLRDGVEQTELKRVLGTDQVESAVEYHDLDPGELVFVPPGTVHALCRGTVIYEVQQASELTFRLYDYGRMGLDGKPRELHTEAAMEVVRVDSSLQGPRPWSQIPHTTPAGGLLVDCDYFRLQLVHTTGGTRAHSAEDTFQALTVTEGTATVRGSDSSCTLHAGCSALVVTDRGFEVEVGSGAELEYLIATPVAD